MTITIRGLHPFIGGEAIGVDLREPLDRTEVAAIEAGMDRHAVLVFPGQELSDAQQVAFSLNFGEIEKAVGGDLTRAEEKRLSLDFADVSNLDRDQNIKPRDDRHRLFGLANRLWHSDSSFRAIPAKYSLLSGRVIPEAGGDTEFADMRAAYDALDEATKREIEDLVCEHSLIYSRAQLGFTELSPEEQRMFKPVRQRLVRTHPVTGRKSLFLSSHIGTIVGWPMPEARDLIRELTEHATQRQFVYAHRWRVNDLVVWDNRQTMHRVRRFADTSVKRDVRRTTVAGDGPTAEQAV
jgi:alpha-ketoglutarate-dependent 2,4-dichlorophenoxyacetate dioxygenase